MWWKAFLAALGLIFVAELGDKTQLAILALASRYAWRTVFWAAASAFALLNALAVSVGAAMYRLLPEVVVRYAAAAVFLGFGLWTLVFSRDDGEKGVGEAEASRPFLSVFLLVCLMELGDKTQLSLLALTARYANPLFVFLGGTLALWGTTLLGALAGKGLGRVIPPRFLRWVAGTAFLLFGILALFW